MKAVLQRCADASVAVDGEVVGRCQKGFLILLGVAENDSESEADKLAAKISKLRVFDDADGKMNLSIIDVGGEVLLVSQFTLLADCRRGNRPDYFGAAAPDAATRLYEYFGGKLRETGLHVETGVFGADMKVTLTNDGPVTIILDTDELNRPRGH